jgi:hypothetical protein
LPGEEKGATALENSLARLNPRIDVAPKSKIGRLIEGEWRFFVMGGTY